MAKIFGITFKENGKVYYFSSGDVENIEKGNNVIVDTEKGQQFANVVSEVQATEVKINLHDLKEILRVSTKEDYNIYLRNLKDATEALKQARKIAEELGLEMTILDANYTFDKKQLLYNFTADNRVDFRELAKKLASLFRTRIELRQIGARDKAKEIGGIGQCGQCLCCNTFLNRMDSITMNMAKNQNIALNPSKINGQCGRLLCCLTYENEEYIKCQKGMPYVGQTVKTDYGMGRVINVDILNRKYVVDIDGDKKEIQLKYCDKHDK